MRRIRTGKSPSIASAFVASGLLFLHGCGNGTSSPGSNSGVVSDTTVIQYGRVEGTLAPFQVAKDPEFVFGWSSDDYPFGEIVSAAIFEDGYLAVADGMNGSVVWISSGGIDFTVLGQPGDGPGEFHSIDGLIKTPSNEIFVSQMGGRFTVLDREGVVLEGRASENHALSALGFDSEGRVLLGPPATHSIPAHIESHGWLRLWLKALDTESGSVSRTFAVDWLQTPDANGGDPFAPVGHVTVAHQAVVYARGDRRELRWTAPGGGLRRSVTWVGDDRLVSDSIWAAYEESTRGRLGERLDSHSIDVFLNEARRSAKGRLPPIGGLMADDRGRVWVAPYTIPGQSYTLQYTVFGSAGELIGVVKVPQGLEVLSIGRERLVGLVRSDTDVQAVAVYRLEAR